MLDATAMRETRSKLKGTIVVAAAAVLIGAAPPAKAQFARAPAPDSKPYDDRLMRLSEILGAVHYLRELCSANEGQFWREKMKELTDSEGTSALRRAKLARSFNQGYRSYSRTYNSCTPSAQTAIGRFLNEALQLTEGMVKNVP